MRLNYYTQRKEKSLAENSARELSKSISRYLCDKWMTWVDQPLGSVWQACPRADVVAVAKSYSPIIVRIYEVKVSRSDFQRDIFEGKYKSYLPFCHYLYFAVPAGLLKKEEVPEGCGLVTFRDKNWHAVKSPIKRLAYVKEKSLAEESKMTEEEMCPEAREYLEWFNKEWEPRVLKFAAHLVNCSQCQRQILSAKDSVGFQILTMSDEKFMETLRERLRQAGDSV